MSFLTLRETKISRGERACQPIWYLEPHHCDGGNGVEFPVGHYQLSAAEAPEACEALTAMALRRISVSLALSRRDAWGRRRHAPPCGPLNLDGPAGCVSRGLSSAARVGSHTGQAASATAPAGPHPRHSEGNPEMDGLVLRPLVYRGWARGELSSGNATLCGAAGLARTLGCHEVSFTLVYVAATGEMPTVHEPLHERWTWNSTVQRGCGRADS